MTAQTIAARLPGRRIVVGLVVMIGLLVGFAVAALVFRDEAPSNFSGAPSVDRIELPAAGAIATVTPAVAPAPIDEPPSARAALEQYLTAETDRRSDVSFALVDRGTTDRVKTVAAWESERANRLLPESFTVTSVRVADGGTDVTVAAARQPAVSPLTGLVPARSAEVWRVVREDDRWRVLSGQPVDVQPVLPPDAAAVDAATAWLERAAACDDPGTQQLQLPGAVLGSPSLAEGPCEQSDSYSAAGASVALAELPNSTVFVSAYGPGVGRWGRAVAVTGERRFTIVLAPLGDEWRVMGLVPDGSPRP